MQVHMDYEGRKSRVPHLCRGRKKGRFWRVNQGVRSGAAAARQLGALMRVSRPRLVAVWTRHFQLGLPPVFDSWRAVQRSPATSIQLLQRGYCMLYRRHAFY